MTSRRTMARTIDYYDRRTSHGSTLSYVTHAAALAELDPESSWERFLVALESDIGDIQGGTTKEGIHMGVMSGTLDLVKRGYLGCEVRGDVLYFKPRLLDRLEGLSFSMQFHGAPFRLRLADGHLTVTAHTEARFSADQDRHRRRDPRAGSTGQLLVVVGPDTGRGVMDADRSTAMPGPFAGAVFDVDGVLVDSPHERAWREALQAIMRGHWSDIRERTSWSPEAFTPQVYRQVVSGRPRMSGARAVLELFQVPDAGSGPPIRGVQAGDDPRADRGGAVRRLPRRAALRTGGPGARAAHGRGFVLEERPALLRRIRLDTFAREHGQDPDDVTPGQTLLDIFDADLSGRDFAHGKPHPEIFVASARELGVPASAVLRGRGRRLRHPGREGRRHGRPRHRPRRRRAALAAAGADLVVTSLDQVDLGELARGRLATR